MFIGFLAIVGWFWLILIVLDGFGWYADLGSAGTAARSHRWACPAPTACSARTAR